MNMIGNLSSLVLAAVVSSAVAPVNHDNKQATVASEQAELIDLAPDSPKRRYLQELIVTAVPRPVLEPVAGKVTYDETRTARVSSPLRGRVVSSLKPLGAKVAAGEELVVLDSPDLGDAEADYNKAQANLRLAQSAYERVKSLYQGMAVPRKDVDQAADDLANARSEVTRTRQKLTNLNVGREQSDERFALRSPVAGTIIERNITPGLEVRSDLDKPLYVVSDLSQVWVLMEVFEKDLGQVHAGRQVAVSVPAYPNERFTGTVDYVGQEVDEDTRTVKVRCVLANPDGKLLPAMYATVELQSNKDDQAIVVPLQALYTEGETDWIFVKRPDGRYQRRRVNVGLRLKDSAVIESGLAVGETIVSAGALALRAEEKITDSAQTGAKQSKEPPP
jgi:membrane fusion protein, heavy metal efflux system